MPTTARDDAPHARRSVYAVLLAAYSVFLAVVVLSPSSRVQSSIVYRVHVLIDGPLPNDVSTLSRVEVLLNALMVAPVTFLAILVFRGSRWHQWTAYGFLGASAVELFQGVFLPARTMTFSDVVANTAGACLGALVAEVLCRVLGTRAGVRATP